MTITDAACIGIVGVGGLGEVHPSSLLETPGCDVVAVCAASEEHLPYIQERSRLPQRSRTPGRSSRSYTTRRYSGADST
jgi:hypothetical protein